MDFSLPMQEAKTYPVNQQFLNRTRVDNNIPLRAGDLRWVDLNHGTMLLVPDANTVSDPGDQRVVGNNAPAIHIRSVAMPVGTI